MQVSIKLLVFLLFGLGCVRALSVCSEDKLVKELREDLRDNC